MTGVMMSLRLTEFYSIDCGNSIARWWGQGVETPGLGVDCACLGSPVGGTIETCSRSLRTYGAGFGADE